MTGNKKVINDELNETHTRKSVEKKLIHLTEEDVSKATKENMFLIDLDKNGFTDILFYSGTSEMKEVKFHIRTHAVNIKKRLDGDWEGWGERITIGKQDDIAH